MPRPYCKKCIAIVLASSAWEAGVHTWMASVLVLGLKLLPRLFSAAGGKRLISLLQE